MTKLSTGVLCLVMLSLALTVQVQAAPNPFLLPTVGVGSFYGPYYPYGSGFVYGGYGGYGGYYGGRRSFGGYPYRRRFFPAPPGILVG
uniref:Putative secreted salivary gland peptide ixodes scapularis n=1 Tax=Aedes albopictus TaxID=7160 RepID=A0A023EEA4_AEDAL